MKSIETILEELGKEIRQREENNKYWADKESNYYKQIDCNKNAQIEFLHKENKELLSKIDELEIMLGTDDFMDEIERLERCVDHLNETRKMWKQKAQSRGKKIRELTDYIQELKQNTAK